MLMEHSAESSHGSENAKKSRSFDLERLYDRKPCASAGKKGGSGRNSSNGLKRKLGLEDQNGVEKKSKKEVLLSSLSSKRNGRKSGGKVYRGLCSSSTKSLKSELGVDQKCTRRSGIVLNLNSDVNVPKRPRDLVRRKKFEVDHVLKQEEGLGSKARLAEQGDKLTGTSNGNVSQNGNANGRSGQNGASEGASSGGVMTKVRRKKNYDLVRHLKKGDSQSSVHNGDSLMTKAKRSRKNTKEAATASHDVTKEAKLALDESSRICDDSLDDEENLEANAARMLSSRFDPNCTGFSSGGKSSKLPSKNGFTALISSSRDFATELNSRAESDVASSDTEGRILRPRDQPKGNEPSRKRRHFYEVLSRDLDSYWVLNRRIKVFWPLDQRWYFGYVIGYDPEKKLHHVKYDDREEEWIDLQNETFKLLLLPSEVPGKLGGEKSTMQDNHSKNIEHDETADNSNSYMESEPIISWLARSTRHKSPPSGVRKKQKILNGSAKLQGSSFSEGKIDAKESLEVGSSGRDVDDLVVSSALPDIFGDSTKDRKPLTGNFINRSPIVYFRRRFHRRESQPGDMPGTGLSLTSKKPPVLCGTGPELVGSLHFDADNIQSIGKYSHSTNMLSSDELIWNTDDSGRLKLSIPVTSLKAFGFALSFPLPVVLSNLFGALSYMFTLQHGTLISVWPMVHLEMLFVDNTVGLWFLLFEGCLKQAVFFVFMVLGVFCQSNHQEKHVDQQFPVTSVRFRFCGLQYLQKQLVFAFYKFDEVANSKWSYLDRKLRRHCLLTKQLPPSECTYDNIEALRNSGNQLPMASVSEKHPSVMSLRKRSRQHIMSISSGQSACVKLSCLSCGGNNKLGKLPLFALSFAAAPTFFLSLHLKLLMKRSIPSSSFVEQDPICLMDHSECELLGVDGSILEKNPTRSSLPVGSDSGVLERVKSELASCSNLDLEVDAFTANLQDAASCKPSYSSEDSPVNKVENVLQLEKGKAQQTESEPCVLSPQPLDSGDRLSPEGCGPLNGVTIDSPSFDRNANGGEQNCQHSADLAWNVAGVMQSPNRTTPRSIWHHSGIGSSSSSASGILSPAWPDGKQDFLRNGFGYGPKKPRTQVSYSLPFGGHDYNSKNKFNHAKGFSHKRIRRASEKKTLEALVTSQRNIELLSCEANVLVTVGDQGWRECGAKVVLELFDHSEWRLAVKVSGDTKYSYKAHQLLQPGTTNRYTHAMMWKGGKDWILEFPDRSQWTTFKEMYEECYNRNFRAASVKNIPIPGVRPIEANDDTVPEVPFVRPSSKYYRQLEADVDIATDPSRALYDMDSDDERWVAEYRGVDVDDSGCICISDEMFEKAMDVFEKVAYAKQRDHFSSDELEEAVAGLGSLEAMKIIYEHWREKRQKKGMPLIRHLQPPLWEKYQQQIKEWEQAIMKSNAAVSNEYPEHAITIEKPTMFAFCLKPRGLEVPNRGSKQRSQKRLPVGMLGNIVSGDPDALHSLVGRRLTGYGLGDERVVYAAYNQGTSDSSPVLQGSTRLLSPRDAVGLGYFSLSSDGSQRNHYPKLYRNKSKKLCFIPSSNDQQAFPSYSPRDMDKRSAIHGRNTNPVEWFGQMHCQPEGFQRHSFEQLDPSELDEFRLRDAASAARHAITIAKMKRENAQRMLCRADLAMHKAVAAIMTAEAIKASHEEPNTDV